MSHPVDLNAVDESRTDTFAGPLPRPLIEHEIILVFTGLIISVVGVAALSGWTFDVMALVLPVPGFERIAPASAVGLALFGLALALTGTRRNNARRAVVIAMAVLALTQLGVRTILGQPLHEFLMRAGGLVIERSEPPAEVDPLLLMLAAAGCWSWLPRDSDGWKRALATAPAGAMVALALGLLVQSIPTGASPDARSAASAQWTLAALVGGLVLVAASILRAAGGLVVPRRLPWIVGLSSSALVIGLWYAVVQSKDTQVSALVQTANDDALLRLTQIAQKLPSAADFALRLSASPASVPWDSVIPGVLGVATAGPGGRTRVLLSQSSEISRVLDSLALRAVPHSIRILSLSAGGRPLERIALEVENPHLPAEEVVIIARADSVFGNAFAVSQSGMMHQLVQGPRPARPDDPRRFLRAVRVSAITANTWLETWPSSMLLLTQRSVLPELLLVAGLGLAVVAASALAALLRSRHFKESVHRRQVLEAFASGNHPRFTYEWDMTTGRVIRDPGLPATLGYGTDFRVGNAEQWMNLIAPSERAAFEAAFMAHATGRTDSCLLMYHVRAADGTWHRCAERSVVSDRTLDGRPKQVSGEVMDLGRVDETDRVLTTLEQRLERAAGQAVELQALFSSTHRLLIATPEFQQFLDGEDGSGGQERLRAARPEDQEAIRELWLEAGRSGGARADVRLQSKAGVASTVEMALTRIATPSGNELLLQMRDVTALRVAERRRLESQRLVLLGRLAGRVAHEINNPLGGLSNAAALLRRMGHNAADRERYVATMEREVQNIAHVVRQLYETLEWGDTVRPEASVQDVVRGALDTLRERYSEVSVWQEIAPEARQVAVPEAVLRLVLYAVLRNAFRGAAQGRRVQVISRREGDEVVILVDNHGAGISTPCPTVQGAAQAENRADLALGLPFAREVLEVFDGVLVVDEGTENGGTTFTTRWPVSARPRRT